MRATLLAFLFLLPSVALAGADGDGFSVEDGDCDDDNVAVYPGAPELCNGGDDDCDGLVPADEIDLDGDGVRVCAGDCDDLRAWVRPGNPEGELCDGLDSDCVGGPGPTEFDADGDGWLACAGDCDDTNPTVYPTAPEGCDGLDTDCVGGPTAGEIDVDGDGQPPCAGDCDDGNAAVRLGSGLDQCDDEVDGDCDGIINDDCAEPGDDDDDGTAGCESRGCGWSIGTPDAALLILLPLGFVRRRRRLGVSAPHEEPESWPGR